MRKSNSGFTLLEVVILLAVSIVLMVPGYSHISSISRVRAEASRSRKIANRSYELIETVKRKSTEELLEGLESQADGMKVRAWAEYDLEFKEAREAKGRSDRVELPHEKLNVYLEVYEGEDLIGEYDLTRVEEDSVED